MIPSIIYQNNVSLLQLGVVEISMLLRRICFEIQKTNFDIEELPKQGNDHLIPPVTSLHHIMTIAFVTEGTRRVLPTHVTPNQMCAHNRIEQFSKLNKAPNCHSPEKVCINHLIFRLSNEVLSNSSEATITIFGHLEQKKSTNYKQFKTTYVNI
jgi:hypothetical protein